ncbi:Fe(3+)-hydroxamate ABC transporter permease FhuB [Aeromonas simiae]|uniref:Fe(3+)-hydroxamate ABC transporter permease FhuB n=1 Tax=Aeromonas simiae TaxID=218936 RepID=UPI00266B725C|nr:Fe(3+)-hydroxamate ABC transporter permease FhuB [Aeromonas simiae]MDO2949615.1 Fe(3+)-hydroxamate ABC transporter permease FhuB [Aeromonas simiae]MDO2953322.1 Fe(3+)-hydroxamate ABC transporter permease FhuB [Aeromonas simiae]MDO2956946.1 Fe(3+)-hydroxamate ABC transporter permease FhuB [Aeromonas simiae]
MSVHRYPAAPLCAGLFGLTLLLALCSLGQQLPMNLWWQGLLAPAPDQPGQLVLHFSWLPRLALCLLAGAALGLAGLLLQQVLRNPLASPTTLGVSAGAQLALLLATLYAPALLVVREGVALAGGGAAMGLVYLLTWRRSLTPLVIVFAGLVVSLYVGAISSALMLFHQEELKGLLVWGSGALTQDGWGGVTRLLCYLLPALGVALLLLRPLALLDLDEASARSLGLPLRPLRLAAIALGVFLTASVVSVAGVIGFIGLAAPALVRLLGVRSFTQRLLWSGLLGSLLLSATDQLLQLLAGLTSMLLPTGAMTGLLGAPMLLWLIPRLVLRKPPPSTVASAPARRHPMPARLLWQLLLALLLVMPLALAWGQGAMGWRWLPGELWHSQLEWRLPRLLAAAAVGLLLALCGTLLQRISRNPMASPELLGVSGGTVMGLLLAALLLPMLPLPLWLLCGVVGALLTLLLLVGINRRSGFQPERVLLSGLAITAMLEPLQSVVMANGDPRVQQLLNWIAGSTYYVTAPVATGLVLVALLLLALALLLVRWLDLLPLGQAAAAALGVNLRRAQLCLLLLVAVGTALATLVIGPVSFVGLLAPHLARMLGLVRARDQLLGAGLGGALLMVLADWAGQQWLFPMELPAGLVATLIGGAYFMGCLRRI